MAAAEAAMADLLVQQVVAELPLYTPSAFAVSNDDDGWVSLADVHALTETEVQQLMDCTAMVVDSSWQLVVIGAQMRQADDERRTDRLARLLCVLIRAEVAEGVDTSPLEDTTLRVALRCEDVVPPEMASCVRLARVLACKLDATNAIADICDNASRVE
jgi:hypothetical protein